LATYNPAITTDILHTQQSTHAITNKVKKVVKLTVNYDDGTTERFNHLVPGFEHFRWTQEDHQGSPGSSSQRQTQESGKQSCNIDAPPIQHADTDSDKATTRPSAPKKSLKRTRSEGPARRLRQARGGDGEVSGDEEEGGVPPETTGSFCMGNIEGLKEFFRHRIDELTMKPVRGIMTAWIKILEPK
jgi:hypothetical protein